MVFVGTHRAAGEEDEGRASGRPARDIGERILAEGACAVGGDDVEAVHANLNDYSVGGTALLGHQAH